MTVHLSLAKEGFRILGGKGLEYWGGANSQQAHDVVLTSMRRNDVASTSFRRHVPTRFLVSQCQIITFLILKSEIIENSRIELKRIVLPVPSNQLGNGSYPIPVRTPGRFGPIPFRSGRFGLGRFGPILEVGRFGPILVGRFGPLYFIKE